MGVASSANASGYTTAILLPPLDDLASFVDHLNQLGPHVGSSAHLGSEASYLEDPDGLTMEVYADRDRELWPWRGKELDAAVLLVELGFFAGYAAHHLRWRAARTGDGHMHLHIDDLQESGTALQARVGAKPENTKHSGVAVSCCRRLPPSRRPQYACRFLCLWPPSRKRASPGESCACLTRSYFPRGNRHPLLVGCPDKRERLGILGASPLNWSRRVAISRRTGRGTLGTS